MVAECIVRGQEYKVEVDIQGFRRMVEEEKIPQQFPTIPRSRANSERCGTI